MYKDVYQHKDKILETGKILNYRRGMQFLNELWFYSCRLVKFEFWKCLKVALCTKKLSVGIIWTALIIDAL